MDFFVCKQLHRAVVMMGSSCQLLGCQSIDVQFSRACALGGKHEVHTHKAAPARCASHYNRAAASFFFFFRKIHAFFLSFFRQPKVAWCQGDAPSHRDWGAVARVGRRRRRAHEEVQARALSGERERVKEPAMALHWVTMSSQ